MFKKFKDKLAEEVKSSPQRIQQFAQVAQAAVTSASSSISDITNNDLFSIGDNDSTTKNKSSSSNKVELIPPSTTPATQTADLTDFSLNFEDNQRQRRLSNSSFASDISFRLPSYESPSMYHLQSDIEVSASEAEEKGFAGGTVYLDRVTKDQLYAAYRRTQDRCKKYKTQYSDLARHYKLLERENAKAKNVLVETQDKALRRISELKEQCTLEQSAKAHLEKALRVDLEEKQLKIDALNTQLNLLQSNKLPEEKKSMTENNSVQLIDLREEPEKIVEESQALDDSILNKKIEKLESLLTKYKESLKTVKEKNANMATEIQKLTNDLEVKSKENSELQWKTNKMVHNENKNQELLEKIESLENIKNALEFSKNKELSITEVNLQNAKEEILQLQQKIQVLSKREEEYAISLAENKLRIHKELEEKEAEIKSLKISLTDIQNEVKSLNETVHDQKNTIINLETEKAKITNDLSDLNTALAKAENLRKELESLHEKVKILENLKAKSEENINCLHLQLKQETAEKLSVIDRNVYLESRNSQLTDNIEKKGTQINKLENDTTTLKSKIEELKLLLEQNNENEVESNQLRLAEEVSAWKLKCTSLESEIQEERIELGKLQTEIEKLLINHESLQNQNMELNIAFEKSKSDNDGLRNELSKQRNIYIKLMDVKNKLLDIQKTISSTSKEAKTLKESVLKEWLPELTKNVLLHSNVVKDSIYLKQINLSLKEQLEKVKEELQLFVQEAPSLKEDNLSLKELLQESTVKCESLSIQVETLKSNTENIVATSKRNISDLENENKLLVNQKEELENTISLLTQELNSMKEESQQYDDKIKTLLEQNIEVSQLKQECIDKVNFINELESKLQIYSKENDALKALQVDHNDTNMKFETKTKELLTANSIIELKLQQIEQENQRLKLSHNENENNTKQIESDLLELHKARNDLEINVEKLKEQNNEIKSSKTVIENNNKELESKLQEILTDKLEVEKELTSTKTLNQELKSSCDDIAYRHKLLETKFNELQTIHIGMSTDKESLQKIVEKLEKDLDQLKIIQEQNGAGQNVEDSKTCECNSLKDENRRLRSDIEGLQSYLSKISKENSDLNDKMREFIASSDPEGNDYLRNEIQIGKDKIEELLRENSLLIEENLELKDQIQSQIHSTTMNKSNQNYQNQHKVDIDNEKYSTLLENKNQLEIKVNELEQMNNSLNKNVDQTQINYDRLKLSNEKLQRKLDEALVSLRHLHALEENTELEYLRNILYEYLTGSGTHSITLAKVLAAVVKFDDRQTEQVLQKEKERQGFLRQLGII